MSIFRFAIALLLLLVSCKKNNSNLYTLKGNAIGTTFSIKYISKNKIPNISIKIDSTINAVNQSISSYLPNSIISKINKGDTTVVVDNIFKEVYLKSKRIVKETNGEFDPTIGILVNAWGFGPEKKIENLNATKIKALMQLVGFNKVKLKNNKIHKTHPAIYFDFNAIGKGYLIDAISNLFEKENIANYLVEIGGEIKAKGVNQKNKFWRVAIESPNTDMSRTLIATTSLQNESMASSGNYRKFKINEKGEKYVHTINTKTGYATPSNLISASVIGNKDCADIDAYATAFMAMGLEKTKLFLEKHSNLKAFLIFSDKNGTLQTYKTENLVLN